MPLIEFLNTVGFYTSKVKEFNKELKKCQTFESAVLCYLSNLV